MGYYDNSGDAVPWIPVDTNRIGASRNFTLLPELLARKANYTCHAIGKWHLGHVTRAYTPTYRGYESFLGYYDAMTEEHTHVLHLVACPELLCRCRQDYWAHTHSTGQGDPKP